MTSAACARPSGTQRMGEEWRSRDVKGEGWHLNIHPPRSCVEEGNWGLALPPPLSKREQSNGSQRPRSAASPTPTSVTDVATAQGSRACACATLSPSPEGSRRDCGCLSGTTSSLLQIHGQLPMGMEPLPSIVVRDGEMLDVCQAW